MRETIFRDSINFFTEKDVNLLHREKLSSRKSSIMFILIDSTLDNENALSPIFLIPNPNFTFLKLRHPKK